MENIMFKRNQINTALAVSLVLLASSATVNAEVAVDTATVTVQNAFTMASTTPIDFGILRVTQSTAQDLATPSRTTLSVAGTQVATDGVSTAGTDGSISQLTVGTPGRIDITAAAPSTTLTVLIDTGGIGFDGAGDATAIDGVNSIDLISVNATDAADKFVMFVNAAQTQIEGGPNDGVAYDDITANLVTDATGAVGLTFGGTLAWNFASADSPLDEAYTGAYQITVNY
ncbi:MAG: hypothetical protein ACI9MS_001669 [Glaciecola sp.]|jgi:hypothetical protein